jgi:acetolactate synthase small subunit
VIEQIKAQLARMVPVHEVHDLTVEGPSVQRELALFKVAGKGEAPDRGAAAGRDLSAPMWSIPRWKALSSR